MERGRDHKVLTCPREELSGRARGGARQKRGRGTSEREVYRGSAACGCWGWDRGKWMQFQPSLAVWPVQVAHPLWFPCQQKEPVDLSKDKLGELGHKAVVR